MYVPHTLTIDDLKDGKCFKDILAIDLNSRDTYKDFECKRIRCIMIDMNTLRYLLENKFCPSVSVYNKKELKWYPIHYDIEEDNYNGRTYIEIGIAKEEDTVCDSSHMGIDTEKYDLRELTEDETIEVRVSLIKLKQMLLDSELSII